MPSAFDLNNLPKDLQRVVTSNMNPATAAKFRVASKDARRMVDELFVQNTRNSHDHNKPLPKPRSNDRRPRSAPAPTPAAAKRSVKKGNSLPTRSPASSPRANSFGHNFQGHIQHQPSFDSVKAYFGNNVLPLTNNIAENLIDKKILITRSGWSQDMHINVADKKKLLKDCIKSGKVSEVIIREVNDHYVVLSEIGGRITLYSYQDLDDGITQVYNEDHNGLDELVYVFLTLKPTLVRKS